jgi:2-oxoglutarate dehydrogenase E2 component (dihydrolipoamide succinyltransferase)
MSGILEQILAGLQALRAAVAAGIPAGAPVPAAAAIPAPAPVAAPIPAPIDPFAAAPAATAPAQVTEAMVMTLIEPHLDNAPLKAALSAVLGSMGIARLPEARPDQYAALYQAFTGVIAQHAAPAATAAPSII